MEQKQKIIDYWQKTAENDYKIMLSLYRLKHYSYCLFFGHIVLEKILKALVVKNTNEQAPKIHDLVRLQDLAGLGFENSKVILLKEINEFNLATRYPDYKFNFYKKCDARFAKKYLKIIKDLMFGSVLK